MALVDDLLHAIECAVDDPTGEQAMDPEVHGRGGTGFVSTSEFKPSTLSSSSRSCSSQRFELEHTAVKKG